MDDDAAGKGQAALIDAVRELREQVAQLAERISALETASTAKAAPALVAAAPAPVAPAPAPAPELSEELVMVISAAIAAFLGKKPYIRQIRLISSPTWSHQGRVSVQASHALKTYRAGASA